MSYRYDVSYPFLDLAQRYDVSYSDVLMHAGWMEGYLNKDYPDMTDETLARAARLPDDVKNEIAGLVALPVHARGGRTDVCDHCRVEARWNEPLPCTGAGWPECAVTQRPHQ